MHIAQAAWRFLEVRLELINGIAELAIARCLHRDERLQKPVAIFFDEYGEDFAFKFFSSRAIAQEKTGVQKRCVRLHVRLIELFEVRALPDLMPHLEVKIP